ncbi:MAG: DMT family transporter [Gammaproteobacteria bacterium]|nr:DMT family transporter [Gammaproteobacteria bacterium]
MSVPAAYIGIILIWSTTPLAIQWSSDEVGFLFGITSRMMLGVLGGLLVAGLFSIRLPWHTKARRTYLAAGLGLFLAMTSVYWSSQFIPSGWVAVIFGLAPIITGIMATIWLAEQALTTTRIIGMLLGLAGLAIMLLGSQQLGHHASYGIAGMVFSVTAYSASAIVVKRIAADVPALATTIGALVVTVLLLVVLYILTGEPLPAIVPPRAAISIAYLGLVGSVLGFSMYYYVLRHVEATRVALITLLTPVAALMLGHVLNGEALQTEALIGTATILSGLLLFEYGQKAGNWVRDTMTG